MEKKKKFGLNAKLMTLICGSILAVGAVFTYTLNKSVNQSKTVNQALISRSGKMNDVSHITIAFKAEVQTWKDLLLRGSDKEAFVKYESELETNSSEVHKLTEELQAKLSDPKDRELTTHFLAAEKELFENYQNAKQSFLKTEHFDFAGADQALRGKDKSVTESLKELNEVFEKKMLKTASESERTLQEGMWIGLITAAIFTSIILLISWYILRQISLKLSGVTKSIAQVSEHIDGAVFEIATASEQLANANTETAASIEETSASLEEITSMSKRSNEALAETTSLAVKGNETAVRGETEMSLLIGSMTDIKHSSSQMEQIIAAIDDIAFQTNLLALNASVEAARAGEQGKGFAVVAEAVRGLAQRSASSAKDISSLIRESVSKIESGSKIATDNETVLKEIVIAIKRISDLTMDISAMSNEQLAGVEQISKAVSQLDQASQNNAASAEETASASLQLKEQSRTLQGAMSDLRSVIEG